GYIGEKLNWHYGFAAAGVGMVLGLVQYSLTRRHLGEAGLHPSSPSQSPGRDWAMVWAAVAGIVLVTVLAVLGVIVMKPVELAQNTGKVILGMAVFWFTWAFAFGKLTLPEKKRLVVLVILFFSAALFWSGFEQVGSVMSVFAERYTNRVVGGSEAPASWFQG